MKGFLDTCAVALPFAAIIAIAVGYDDGALVILALAVIALWAVYGEQGRE